MANLGSGSLNSVLLGPSENVDPASNRPAFNSKHVGPFGNGLCFVVYGYKTVSSRVSALVGSRCPTAISWLVVSIVVDSIKRMLFARALTHVIVKSVKRDLPRIANFYSSSSPISKVFVFFITASLFHILPPSVCYAFRHSVRFWCALVVGIKASATFGFSRLKAICANIYNFSAITFALPKNGWRRSATTFDISSFVLNCEESCESFSRKIMKRRHERISLNEARLVSNAQYMEIAMNKQGVNFA